MKKNSEIGSLTERIYLNKQETEYQDKKSRLRENIAEILTKAYKFIFKPRSYEKIRLKELIVSINPRSVLEIGAGNDNLYNQIINYNVTRYIRSDVSEGQLNQIKDNRIENMVYDGVKHPLKDNSIDAIFSKCVMHHVDNGSKEGREKNRIDFLKEQKRLIHKGGRVYCVDVYSPYKNGLKGALWHLIKHRIILGEEEHNFLTTKEAIKLFEKAGFKGIKYEEVNTYKGKYFIVSGGK